MASRASVAEMISGFSPSDYTLLSAVLGTNPNLSVRQIECQNDDIDSASTPETLWSVGGTVVWPSSAGTTSVVSSDANDTSAGTGARTVLLTGLDANRNVISETVTLNGITPVDATASFLRVNSAEVKSAGTGLTNAGNITITINDGSSRTVNYIDAGFSVSQVGIYSMPNATTFQKGLLVYQAFSASRGGTGYVDISIMKYEAATGVRSTIFDVGLEFTGTSSKEFSLFRRSLILEPGDDLEIRATATSANNVKAEGKATILLFGGRA